MAAGSPGSPLPADQERHPAARLERARHGDELRHHAVGVAGIPFLPEALVRLDEADGAELANRERPLAPRTVPPSTEDCRKQGDARTPPEGPAPRSPLPAR